MKRCFRKWLSLMITAVLIAGVLPADAYSILAKEQADSGDEIVTVDDTELISEVIFASEEPDDDKKEDFAEPDLKEVTYGLWIGGEQITSGNLVIDGNDIPGVTGSAEYIPADNILKLNDFKYSGTGGEHAGLTEGQTVRSAIYTDIAQLVIEASGTNSINVTGNTGNIAAVCSVAEGELNLDGEGKLTVSAADCVGSSIAVYGHGVYASRLKLIVSGGKSQSKQSYGIKSESIMPATVDEYTYPIGGAAGAYNNMIATGQTAAISMTEGSEFGCLHGRAYEKINDDEGFNLAPRRQPIDAARLDGYKLVYTQATGVEYMNISRAGATFVSESMGVGDSGNVHGKYLKTPDSRMTTYWETGAPLFPEDGYSMGSDSIPLNYTFASSTTPTVHEIDLYGEEKLDPSLFTITGATLKGDFTVNVYGDNLGGVDSYGITSGVVLYTYSALIEVPAADTPVHIYYDDVEITGFMARRDANRTKAKQITTFRYLDFEDDDEGTIKSFRVEISGFNLPTGADDYYLMPENNGVSGEDGGSMFTHDPGLEFAQLKSVEGPDAAGRIILNFDVTHPELLNGTGDGLAWMGAYLCAKVTGESSSVFDAMADQYINVGDNKYSTLIIYPSYEGGGAGAKLQDAPIDATRQRIYRAERTKDAVTSAVNISSDETGDMAVLAVYGDNGKLLYADASKGSEPSTLFLSTGLTDARTASVLLLDKDYAPVIYKEYSAIPEAAESDVHVYEAGGLTADADGKYSVTCTGTQTGKSYTLIALAGGYDAFPVLTDTEFKSKLLYIDAEEASGTSLSFTFIPRRTEQATIFLAGKGNAPEVVASIDSTESSSAVVSFDKGKGSGTMAPVNVLLRDVYTLPECTFTAPTGKIFDKWDLGEPGTVIALDGDVTIHALWRDTPTYEVIFDINDGSGYTKWQSVKVHESAKLMKNEFAREGYSFMGWSLLPYAEEADYADEALVTDLGAENEIVTLYAVWKEGSSSPEIPDDSVLEDLPSDADTKTKVSSLKFTKSVLKLTVGESLANAAEVKEAKNTSAPVLYYVTSNRNIVTVDQKGNFKATGTGTATVTAYCGNKKAVCKVTVSSYTTDIAITDHTGTMVTDTEMHMAAGAQDMLYVVFDPVDSTDNRAVTWKSDNTKAVKVSGGLITACEVKQEASAVITASVKVTDPSNIGKTITKTAKVTVKVSPVTMPEVSTKDATHTLAINKGSLKMETTKDKNTVDLEIKVTPKKQTRLDSIAVESVISTNEDIVSVSTPSAFTASGTKGITTVQLTANAPGTAYVFVATKGEGSASANVKKCKVIVTSPAKTITLEDGSISLPPVSGDGIYEITMRQGTYGTVAAVVSPSYSTEAGRIKWSGTGGVTVKNGLIYAKTITKPDKNKYAYVTVKCGKAAPVKIKITVTR